MRIVIADLLFSWPPHGGAEVDVYHVARRLVRLGHDVRLLFVHESTRWERGRADGVTIDIAYDAWGRVCAYEMDVPGLGAYATQYDYGFGDF